MSDEKDPVKEPLMTKNMINKTNTDDSHEPYTVEYSDGVAEDEFAHCYDNYNPHTGKVTIRGLILLICFFLMRIFQQWMIYCEWLTLQCLYTPTTSRKKQASRQSTTR